MGDRVNSSLDDILAPSDYLGLGSEIQGVLSNGGTLQDIFGFSPELMDAQYEIAYDHFQKQEYVSAITELSYLTNINPYIKKYWQALAAAQMQSKLYPDAINSYAAAALLEPNDPTPPLYMGIAHVQLNQYIEAVENFEKAVELAKVDHQHSEIEKIASKWSEDLKQGG
jgi:type III secretion system low calcium response chaperone LcrH/SycD